MLTRKRQEYASLLRTHGLKATPIRIQLISHLEAAREPLGAHEMQKLWQDDAVDIVTLYRAFEALARAGIIRRVDVRHGHADYELSAHDHHHHLVCTECGLIEDFKGCPGKAMEQAALKGSSRFSSLREHSLEFFGTCKKCAVHV